MADPEDPIRHVAYLHQKLDNLVRHCQLPAECLYTVTSTRGSELAALQGALDVSC